MHDARQAVPVERAAPVGDQPPVGPDVVEVGSGPLGQQLHQLRVQRHVAVVAQLAQRDAQPVVAADLHDGVGVQTHRFAGAHPGAGQQLDGQPIPRVTAGAGGGDELRRVPVIEETRQRVGLFRDVAVDDRVAGRRRPASPTR